jgi:hypothetical protein
MALASYLDDFIDEVIREQVHGEARDTEGDRRAKRHRELSTGRPRQHAIPPRTCPAHFR